MTPYYEVHFLNVKDADAIIIYYKERKGQGYIALVDAGNVNDSEKIKTYIRDRWHTGKIDLAVCTHPDSDHKGGFFNLLNDPEISITEFWINSPDDVINENEFRSFNPDGDYLSQCRACYSHPTDASSPNLIDLAFNKQCKVTGVYSGNVHPNIPLQVIGPTKEFFKPRAYEILKNQKPARTVDSSIYEDRVMESESATASAINSQPDDSSPTNAGSIILLFTPTEDKKFLFLGDATKAAIYDVLNRYELEHSVVKVPHHGSIFNLTTDIIDRLQPRGVMISAAGSKSHPSVEIVDYLSRHCRVFSTHKSKGRALYYTPTPPKNPAHPLRDKKTIKLIRRLKK